MYYPILLLFSNLIINYIPNYYYGTNIEKKILLLSCLNFYISFLFMFINSDNLYYLLFDKEYNFIISYRKEDSNIAWIMLSYQLINIYYDILNKNYNGIIHHLSVIITAIIVLNGYLTAFINYFYFYMEISTIFLTNKDIFKIYDIRYTILDKINNTMFYISFFVFRNILYLFFYYKTLCVVYLQSTKIEYTLLYSIIITLNIITFLQYYWGYKIFRKIIY